MNNPFAQIFDKTLQRIHTEVPEIKYISHDFGQLEDYSTGRPPVAFPCALIDFQNWNFENMGENSQRAEGEIIIKLGFARLNDTTNNITQEYWREQAMQDYEIEWNLNNALHGWTPDEKFGYFTRSAATAENRPLNVRIRTLRYRLAFEDYSSKPGYATIPMPQLSFSISDEDI